MVEKANSVIAMDKEWVWLIVQAKRLGLEADDVRYFLLEEQIKK